MSRLLPYPLLALSLLAMWLLLNSLSPGTFSLIFLPVFLSINIISAGFGTNKTAAITTSTNNIIFKYPLLLFIFVFE